MCHEIQIYAITLVICSLRATLNVNIKELCCRYGYIASIVPYLMQIENTYTRGPEEFMKAGR